MITYEIRYKIVMTGELRPWMVFPEHEEAKARAFYAANRGVMGHRLQLVKVEMIEGE